MYFYFDGIFDKHYLDIFLWRKRNTVKMLTILREWIFFPKFKNQTGGCHWLGARAVGLMAYHKTIILVQKISFTLIHDPDENIVATLIKFAYDMSRGY